MNKKIIIIAGALTVVLGGAGGVYFLYPGLLPGFARPKEQESHKEAKIGRASCRERV